MSTPTRKLKLSGGTLTGLLSFTGTGHAGLQLNSLTTTQRDALTPANGMLIYNSTTGTVQRYSGGAWVTVSAQQLYAENPTSPTAPVASSNNAVAIGDGATASAQSAFVGGGRNNTASAAYAANLGGFGNAASAQSAASFGEYAVADIAGALTVGGGNAMATGVAQVIAAQVNGGSPDATPIELLALGSSRLTLRNNTLWHFIAQVSAMRRAGAGHSTWKLEGAIYRVANAASTAMLGDFEKSPNSANVAGWDIDATADTTNGALKFTATGGAYAVRWNVFVHIASITYA